MKTFFKMYVFATVSVFMLFEANCDHVRGDSAILAPPIHIPRGASNNSLSFTICLAPGWSKRSQSTLGSNNCEFTSSDGGDLFVNCTNDPMNVNGKTIEALVNKECGTIDSHPERYKYINYDHQAGYMVILPSSSGVTEVSANLYGGGHWVIFSAIYTNKVIDVLCAQSLERMLRSIRVDGDN